MRELSILIWMKSINPKKEKTIMERYKDIIIEIDNRQNMLDFTPDIERLIINCVNKALDVEEFNFKVMIDISLVDNEDIRKINLEYRDVDKATDVLSFPMLDIKPGQKPLVIEEYINDIDPDSGAIILGDI